MIDYFPEKEYFARRAEQQLARIYLREGDFDRAMAIFEKLAALGDDEPELRAFGLAGKCGVLSLRGQYRESAAVLEQLWPIRDKLTRRADAASWSRYAVEEEPLEAGAADRPASGTSGWKSSFAEDG